MKRDILTYPESKDILTQKSEEVQLDEDINELIQDMKDTLNNTTGCGISAIQIGIAKKICIVKYNGQSIIMINPEITRVRGEVTFNEGCLSAPGIYKDIKRAEKVWCKYIDENKNQKELAIGGLASIIIQHELDHFNGWCEVFEDGENKG